MPATCAHHRTALERDGLKGAAQAAAKRTFEPGTLRIRSRRRAASPAPAASRRVRGLGRSPKRSLSRRTCGDQTKPSDNYLDKQRKFKRPSPSFAPQNSSIAHVVIAISL